MNLHEFQAKLLLARHGVAVPAGEVCQSAGAAKKIAENLFAGGQLRVVIKAQIHAGGRGKGAFKNGFQGGVKLCRDAAEVFAMAGAMLGQVLVTKQTGPEGRLVRQLLVAGAPNIQKELYCAVLLDRAAAGPSSWPAPRAAWTSNKSPPNTRKKSSAKPSLRPLG